MAFPPNASKLAAYRSTSAHAGVAAADPPSTTVLRCPVTVRATRTASDTASAPLSQQAMAAIPVIAQTSADTAAPGESGGPSRMAASHCWSTASRMKPGLCPNRTASVFSVRSMYSRPPASHRCAPLEHTGTVGLDDGDADAVTVTPVAPENSKVTLNPDGSYTYDPGSPGQLVDYFQYAVADPLEAGPVGVRYLVGVVEQPVVPTALGGATWFPHDRTKVGDVGPVVPDRG